jgi:hypothetical protein
MANYNGGNIVIVGSNGVQTNYFSSITTGGLGKI